MRRLLITISRWWTQLKKSGGDLVDIFKPRGGVEIRLIHAVGPKKGQVARIIKGRNVVTSFLGATHPDAVAGTTSGRDVMRRLLIPNSGSSSGGFAGELSGNDNCTIQFIRLGGGTTAESSADEVLEAPIAGSAKVITDVILAGTNPFVTFVANYGTSELNGFDISEASLETGRYDFFARKTFGTFNKTSDYSLEVRWTIRF